MSTDADLIKLYSGKILALAADIPFATRLAQPQATAKARAPVCGSAITVDVVMKDGRVAEFRQDVKACALGQAAAAITGAAVIGATPEQIAQARRELLALLTNDGPTPAAPFADFEVLRAAAPFKNRHASIQLALQALDDAISEASGAA